MEQRELLSFVISCCVMLFVLLQWPHLRKLQHAKLLVSSFGALFASWGFSVIEVLFWEAGFNLLQHLSSGVGGILLALWCRALHRSTKPQSVVK
jgi:hypothetical protein